jgi:hypothetical protein
VYLRGRVKDVKDPKDIKDPKDGEAAFSLVLSVL